LVQATIAVFKRYYRSVDAELTARIALTEAIEGEFHHPISSSSNTPRCTYHGSSAILRYPNSQPRQDVGEVDGGGREETATVEVLQR
jgi:hypothetical protein